MDLGNDEYFHAFSLLESQLGEEDRMKLSAERAVVDGLVEQRGFGNFDNDDIEAAIVAAGIEA